MDRISSLPDEIICHIGSFLSAKEAVFVMLLSKKWRNLFTIIPNLHFDGDEAPLEEFVDDVLALPVNTRIRTFSLVWNHSQYVHINRCLCDVVKRGVLVLKLRVKVGKQGGYSLPLDVFTCRTVAKMELGSGFPIDFLPVDVLLPSLKTLVLDTVRFYEFGGRCAFKTLLSASPLLEELVIKGVEFERWKWSCNVSSPTLRRLTIRRKEWYSYDESDEIETLRLDCRCLAYDFDSLSFDTPGLTYLEYSDYVPKEYLFVNLNSLVEAKLDLCVDEDRVWDESHADDFDPMNLINGLKNVEVFDLTIYTTEMLSVFKEAIPVFEKLFQISLRLFNFCWFSLPILIKNSPNLKTLIIEGSLHYGGREDEYICQCVSGYSFLLSCPVEILKINWYKGRIEELEQIKHFLEKLSCLELVEIQTQVSDDVKLQVMADLLRLPRASTKCKIQVKFSRERYLRANF